MVSTINAFAAQNSVASAYAFFCNEPEDTKPVLPTSKMRQASTPSGTTSDVSAFTVAGTAIKTAISAVQVIWFTAALSTGTVYARFGGSPVRGFVGGGLVTFKSPITWGRATSPAANTPPRAPTAFSRLRPSAESHVGWGSWDERCS